ncbi:MAG TPA: hypothetical protein PKD20_01565 [Candidatus Saccharibacteria bacterium]|jgi:hypothetical protein|nr:hypothetical protein [Candidatus Saccharibacteria bacterium]HMT55546.1 hypothetical protein [Candidatus Saccharibacteria bacterium]
MSLLNKKIHMTVGRAYTLFALLPVTVLASFKVHAMYQTAHNPNAYDRYGLDMSDMGNLFIYMFIFLFAAPVLKIFSKQRSGQIVKLDDNQTVIVHESTGDDTDMNRNQKFWFYMTFLCLVVVEVCTFTDALLQALFVMATATSILVPLAFIFYESRRVSTLREIAKMLLYLIALCTFNIFAAYAYQTSDHFF